MKYIGMNQQTGKKITESEHIRQSVRDILLTPLGSRLERRNYGSILADLIDQPQNDTVKLQLMAASYTALARWEQRIKLTRIFMTSEFDGSLSVDITAMLTDGTTAALTVPLSGEL